jgi:hypothetical protein
MGSFDDRANGLFGLAVGLGYGIEQIASFVVGGAV